MSVKSEVYDRKSSQNVLRKRERNIVQLRRFLRKKYFEIELNLRGNNYQISRARESILRSRRASCT